MARAHFHRHHVPIADLALIRFRPRLERLENRCLPSVLTVTSTLDSGPGTLRAELAAAASGDTIVFALAHPSTIQLTSGTLTINQSIRILGPGASALTINGNHTFSIFTVMSSATIDGLTISGGGGSAGGGITNTSNAGMIVSHCVVTGNQSSARGGGILNTDLNTRISDCTISNNTAANGGGGIASTSLTLSRCTISGNIAGGSGGGVDIEGGGLPVTIANTTISSNMAGATGGGIELGSGTLYLTNSSVVSNNVSNHGNGSSAEGGGINASQGSMTILNSIITGNFAQSDNSGPALGGGLASMCPTTILASTIANNFASAGNGGTVAQLADGGGLYFGRSFTLSNCTVSGNHTTSGVIASGSAGDAFGSGVSLNLFPNPNPQPATIVNCTITGNVAALPAFATSGSAAGGGIWSLGGLLNIQNTIVAANSAAADTDFANSSASTTALYNLIGDGTGSNITNSNGNHVGTTQSPIDPRLLPLANYGGPTPTMALNFGPAVDAGTNQGLQATTDQRGYPRIYNIRVDIGAYESQPFHFLAVGADLGGAPEVKVYDATTGVLRLDFNAYESSFKGGVRVAVADMNGDGIPDIITAPGGVKVTLVTVNGALVPSFDFSAGRTPEIKVFSGIDGTKLDDFLAYESSFTAGVFLALADVNHDGMPDIITGPDATGQSGHTNVRVFFNNHLINTGAALTPDLEFNAYDPGFGGGVRVAAAQFTPFDGFSDIVTAPGIWSGPDVRIFYGRILDTTHTGSIVGEFLAYDPRYFGGVFVATGDVNGDGRPDIVTGTNGNGGPEVKAFSGANILSNPMPPILDDFFAYDPAFSGGARVAVMDANGDGQADIVTGAGPGGGPHVRIFNGSTGQQLTNAFDSFMAFSPAFSGGVFVGGS
jgi:predicted outer membrane repeat protein